MANTINGHTVIAAETDREYVAIEIPGVMHNNQVGGYVYRGRIILDTNADFVIDDPTVAAKYTSGMTIMPVGLEYVNTSASTATLRFKEKLGATTNNLTPYKLGATSGVLKTIGPDPITVPQIGYQLIAVCDQSIELVLYYLICDKLLPYGYR